MGRFDKERISGFFWGGGVFEDWAKPTERFLKRVGLRVGLLAGEGGRVMGVLFLEKPGMGLEEEGGFYFLLS